MPLDKPIPDSVLNYWKNVFKNFRSKFSDTKKSQLVMDPIQVLGLKDRRREVQVKDENTAGQLLVKNTHAEERYVRGMSKTAKRHYINRKDCPVKKSFSWSTKVE